VDIAVRGLPAGSIMDTSNEFVLDYADRDGVRCRSNYDWLTRVPYVTFMARKPGVYYVWLTGSVKGQFFYAKCMVFVGKAPGPEPVPPPVPPVPVNPTVAVVIRESADQTPQLGGLLMKVRKLEGVRVFVIDPDQAKNSPLQAYVKRAKSLTLPALILDTDLDASSVVWEGELPGSIDLIKEKL